MRLGSNVGMHQTTKPGILMFLLPVQTFKKIWQGMLSYVMPCLTEFTPKHFSLKGYFTFKSSKCKEIFDNQRTSES